MTDTGFSNSSGYGDNNMNSNSNSGQDRQDFGSGGNQDSNFSSSDNGMQQDGFQGGVGDRSRDTGAFGGGNVQQPSSGDQYGSSGGYGGVPSQGQNQDQGQGYGQGQGQGFGQEQGQGQGYGQGQGQGQGFGQGQGQGQGDALDKGVDFAERKSGHEMGHSTTEKISDGIRTGFKKMTGKDVPVKDQNYD